nr:putative ribonuclease H-like domain-containing protein [Tanacetum cinerariifolium]
MEHSTPTLAKIPILDTGKFEQWQFRIQQYLQHEHSALWEVIEFRDSYVAPKEGAATDSAGEGTATKKGRTVAITTEDMKKRRNDVKARTTLLLALLDEHRLRFSKYKTAQELWVAILKTFGGNEATKKTKKNLLKQQYGNFKTEGSKTLEQTFNRQQIIVSQLESDLDMMSLDDLYNHLKVYESEVQKKSESNSQNMGFISSAKNSSGKEEVNTASIPTASTNVSPASANIRAASISQDTACAYIASQSNGSQIKFEDINQIDEDDIEEMDIKWNMALLSMRADIYWKRTGKKITIQGTDVAGFDKSKVECFNCHKIGHFARECRASRSQERGRRDNYRQGSKVEEQALKSLMVIDGVGWDWSFMANKEENHALVADEEAPTEFALMAKTSTGVFDNSICPKSCKKNTDSLNSKITDLIDKLSDSENMLYHYKLGLSQVEGRLVEFKNQEVKFCEKIRGLEFSVKCKTNRIENLTKELETLKNEKEGLESKLTGFKSATKDLDHLIGSQRSDKIKEGLGYSVVPPPPAQVSSPPKKDMSWTGLLKFTDDTITDYTRPFPIVESNPNDLQNSSSSASGNEESTGSILSKPEIKFIKPANSPTIVKTDKKETVRKPTVKYAKLYRKTTKRKWVDHGRSWAKNNNTHKRSTPRTVVHKTGRPPMRTNRPYMNDAQPKRTSFYKPAHSYNKMPFQRTSAVRSQFRGPRVATVNRKFPTVNRKFPTVNREFPTGNIKFSTADMGNKGKAGNSQINIDDKGYWDSGCSWHMTGNIFHLTDYEPYDGGYVSFGQGGCKITGKGRIKTDESMLWHRRLGHLNFKTMNRLVRHNLVRGLPSKCFDNDHSCVSCLKGKQHKASCKTKLVNSVTKPLHTLHIDLFGPTSVSSLNHKWNFITKIENLKELRVKIIRCNNRGEFKNKEMNDLCLRKGIKREFSNARTPQRNGVAEMRNRTLIEAARTMLADAKLLVTFWAEAVNTACYVQE